MNQDPYGLFYKLYAYNLHKIKTSTFYDDPSFTAPIHLLLSPIKPAASSLEFSLFLFTLGLSPLLRGL